MNPFCNFWYIFLMTYKLKCCFSKPINTYASSLIVFFFSLVYNNLSYNHKHSIFLIILIRDLAF